MNTQIQPLEIPLKGTATQLFIRTATVEEVEAWGDSMEYIENLVLNKLGLTKNQ